MAEPVTWKLFPLRLPRSTRAQAYELARREGVSLNQFIVQAVAEKITRMELTLALNAGLPK